MAQRMAKTRHPLRATSIKSAVSLAKNHAPFLRRLLRQEEDIPALIERDGPERVMKTLHEMLAKIDPAKTSSAEVMATLRLSRGRAALTVALVDLAGIWSEDQVTAALSDFADACIVLAVQNAVAVALAAKRLPLRRKSKALQLAEHGLACLALGKLGGRELNYSSDVDLVFVFDETGVLADSEATEAYSRIVHQVARTLNETTADGYVFRVDLRLRPDPNATPPAISMAAAENYYQSQALTWERAAFTRARVCGGDIKAGAAFLQRLRGWIWRRSLDFTAILDIHSMREQILEHFDLADFDPAGFDVKRGVGGIREIEFLLQMQQLIHAGRRPSLQTGHTPAGLAQLAALGLMPADTAATLTTAYHWLRKTEHRVQMLNDQQTHTIPADLDERTGVAHFCGYPTLTAFEKVLKNTCSAVREIYLQTVGPTTQAPPADENTSPRNLGDTTEIIKRWQSGRYRSLTHPRARAALASIQPQLFAAFAKSADPVATLTRWDRFLERLPSGVALLEMFGSSPKLLGLISRVMSLSEKTGEQLARHPQLLDAVFDDDFFAPVENPDAQLTSRLFPHQDFEGQWSATTRWVAEKRFQLAVQVLDSLILPRDMARAHAAVLDSAIRKIVELLASDIARQHGVFKNNAPVVLAVGGWGGKALGLSSDLDMILLFTGKHDALSNGAKPLTGTHYFNRFATRFINLLTAASGDGALATVDTRLRPSGAKGLLAVSVDSFKSYQLNDAWTWEHMALTRARVVAGPPEATGAALASVFAQARSWPKLRTDILDMRKDMDAHRAAKSAWDMKLSPGGLVDIEFILHALQLQHAARHPSVIAPVLEDAISALHAHGALGNVQAGILNNAWIQQYHIRSILSLCADGDETRTVSMSLAKLLGGAKPASVLKKIVAARTAVLDIWHTVFDEPRAIEGETHDR